MSHNRTHYRFVSCPRCDHQFEWLGSRLPNYCPECGKPILSDLRDPANAERFLISDPEARVKYESTRNVDNVALRSTRPVETPSGAVISRRHHVNNPEKRGRPVLPERDASALFGGGVSRVSSRRDKPQGT